MILDNRQKPQALGQYFAKTKVQFYLDYPQLYCDFKVNFSDSSMQLTKLLRGPFKYYLRLKMIIP